MKPEEIKSNSVAKRAFELAEAGGLSILLIGPRGSSKTTLREAHPSVRSDERDSCTCGNYQNPGRECACNPRLLYRWYRRIERVSAGFDIVLEACPTPTRELLGKSRENPEEAALRRAQRITAAREFGRTHTSVELVDDATIRTAEMCLRRLSLTVGQWNRILTVARVVANFDASETLKAKHVAEAVQYSGTMFRPERMAAA